MSILCNRKTYHQQKGVVMVTWLFKGFAVVVMQRVARACQRQLSYLSFIIISWHAQLELHAPIIGLHTWKVGLQQT